MLDRLLRIEAQFARAEALLLVVFVLLMLSLATYNVFYGNVLVPIQVSILTADAPSAPSEKATPDVEPAATSQEPPTDDSAGEGFGGDFDAVEEPGPDDESGFGGDFGEPEATAEPAPEDTPTVAPTAEESGGFGGDFGDSDAPTAPTDGAEGFGGGFGGDFGDAEPVPAADVAVDVEETVAAAPEELPFIARAIDAVKLEWIDVLLRQLVLIVGFLGAMLATRRRKHITIDALSKLLPTGALHWVDMITNVISIGVCTLLAIAGSDLVAISIEYPKELTSWADEWQFQLAFPIGFGLLALHFGVRLVESFYYATGIAEPPANGGAV